MVDDGQAPLDFEQFYVAEFPGLLRSVTLLTGDFGEAEELAQEAMVRAYERWDRIGRMESPSGYLYRTALNLNRKRLRKLAVRARRLLVGEPVHDPAASVGRRREILGWLASLSLAEREAVILVKWLGWSTEEAARFLGIEASSVRVRLHRARAALREQRQADEVRHEAGGQ